MMMVVVAGVAFLAWQMHKSGQLNLGSLGLGGGGTTTTPTGQEPVFEGDKETNPPVLKEPVPNKVKQQLMSGITIPTLEIAPQIVEAMDFYAERISEEVRTHAKANLSTRDALEIKGVALLHHKIELLDIAFLNGQGSTEDVQGITSTVLTPPALKIFAGVVLKVVRRMGIRLKENSQRLFELFEAAGESLDYETIESGFPSEMIYGTRGYNARIRGLPFGARFNKYMAMNARVRRMRWGPNLLPFQSM